MYLSVGAHCYECSTSARKTQIRHPEFTLWILDGLAACRGLVEALKQLWDKLYSEPVQILPWPSRIASIEPQYFQKQNFLALQKLPD